jgi:hypothetical protein
VIQPPTVGPSVGASVLTMPRTAGIIARCGPENIAKPAENTVGTMAPPTNPCSARNAIMDSMFHASPHSALDNVNKPADNANSQRVDKACARKPENGIMTSSAIR